MSEESKRPAYLELVELTDGDIVLRHSAGEGEPMVLIRFSAESREWLGGSRMEVARQMVQAGIQAFNRLNGGEAQEAEASEPERRKDSSGMRIIASEESGAEQELEEEMPTVH